MSVEAKMRIPEGLSTVPKAMLLALPVATP